MCVGQHTDERHRYTESPVHLRKLSKTRQNRVGYRHDTHRQNKITKKKEAVFLSCIQVVRRWKRRRVMRLRLLGLLPQRRASSGRRCADTEATHVQQRMTDDPQRRSRGGRAPGTPSEASKQAQRAPHHRIPSALAERCRGHEGVKSLPSPPKRPTAISGPKIDPAASSSSTLPISPIPAATSVRVPPSPP